MRLAIHRVLPRVQRLARLVSPKWLRFLLLVATDPRLDYLEPYLARPHSLRPRRPEPHYARGAKLFLERILQAGDLVIEWGSGNSTLWYLGLGCRLQVIEHSPQWAEKLRRYAADGTLVIHRLEDYERYINPMVDWRSAKLIAVDGIFRNACLSTIVEQIVAGNIRSGTYVLLDDAQRPEYAEEMHRVAVRCSRFWVFGGPVWVDLDHVTIVWQV